jgi:DEAD/DEAH box helicase domain-containing protein
MPGESPSDGIAQGLAELGSREGQIAHVEHLAASGARHGSLSRQLPQPLNSYLTQRGIQLWSHQTQTIEALRNGENVILATSTASGKTLSFTLPVFEHLAVNPQATALYLYPMKALANDQLTALAELEKDTEISLGAAVYDGDTPSYRRAQIRERSRLIISNPYGIHEYLAYHDHWGRFFSQLAVVVIDEAHWYRGVFGSNVAMVLRRLRRIASHYGASPRFVLASATIANPGEHAQALVGLRHRVIAEDGAPHGSKEFVLWNPIADPDRSPHQQAADLLAHFVNAGCQTICFTVSRNMAELVARWAKRKAPGRRIVAYRAGYRPGERREIETKLRSGEIDGVATTSALELGIDIGQLDVAIMAGYPGTICSTWQRAGRAGRKRKDSIAILVAFEDPLDQYLTAHPAELFGKPHENAVLDLANPRILSGHLTCAASELAIRDLDSDFFGPWMTETVNALTAERVLARTPGGHAFDGTFRPSGSVRLDAIDDQAVQVRCNGRLLEVMSLRRALTAAHPGAILLHRGRSYRVQRADFRAGIADAVAERTDDYTETLRDTSIRILDEQNHRRCGAGVALHIGRVRTSERFRAYRLKSRDQVLKTIPLDLPRIEMDTTAIWLTFTGELKRGIREQDHDFAGGLHAAEHALIHMMPLLTMCERHDVGGISSRFHRDARAPVIYVYDRYPGGIGISEKAYEQFEQLAEIALGLVRDCSCENGCPSCVYDRNCASDNQPMDRPAAVSILQAALATRTATGPRS